MPTVPVLPTFCYRITKRCVRCDDRVWYVASEGAAFRNIAADIAVCLTHELDIACFLPPAAASSFEELRDAAIAQQLILGMLHALLQVDPADDSLALALWNEFQTNTRYGWEDIYTVEPCALPQVPHPDFPTVREVLHALENLSDDEKTALLDYKTRLQYISGRHPEHQET